MLDGPERVQAARWYTEWTGAASPRRGGIDASPQPPGFGCASADDAYDRYMSTLEAHYSPGRLGRPRGRLRAIMRRKPRELSEAPGGSPSA
jgi:hypothetical protein